MNNIVPSRDLENPSSRGSRNVYEAVVTSVISGV